eukprot:TRINITY_DN462_c0_g1_i2.p1 TRINITY_DN462_c0_g1~~TRINITY_DN462_c0_g1_i2.p1  ORF type:complete len:620 (+),score=150.65 TRINITY_DN462_c0_g1_i2:944-2803(+)
MATAEGDTAFLVLDLNQLAAKSAKPDKKVTFKDESSSSSSSSSSSEDEDDGEEVKPEGESEVKKPKAGLSLEEDGYSDEEAVGTNTSVIAPSEKTSLYSHRPQQPFQPSSSPLSLSRRFLVYNAIGSIVTRDLGEHAMVCIELADHKKTHVKDFRKCTMGALSTVGAALATSEVLMFKPLDSGLVPTGFPYTQWTRNFTNETIQAIAVNDNAVIAATSRCLLHVFSLTGHEVDLLHVGGTPVCAAARDNCFAVAHNFGCGMRFKIWRSDFPLVEYVLVGDMPSPSIKWLGFSTNSLLSCVTDNDLVLQYMMKSYATQPPLWDWVPLLALEVKDSQYPWVIDVDVNTVLYVNANEKTQYPITNPVPYVKSMPIRVPCQIESNPVHEEQYLQKRMQVAHTTNTLWARERDLAKTAGELIKVDAETIHLFKAACKEYAKEERALDVCHQLLTPKAVQVAVNFAENEKRIQLAGKIRELSTKPLPAYEPLQCLRHPASRSATNSPHLQSSSLATITHTHAAAAAATSPAPLAAATPKPTSLAAALLSPNPEAAEEAAGNAADSNNATAAAACSTAPQTKHASGLAALPFSKKPTAQPSQQHSPSEKKRKAEAKPSPPHKRVKH